MYHDSIAKAGQEALRLAKLGLHVFPVFEIAEDGNCACGRRDCNSPGKHPRTQRGFHDATTDLDQIRRWSAKYPDANWGCRTGPQSGTGVIDVDDRHAGRESLARIEARFGPLPKTVTAATGGDGLHLYFAYPGNRVVRSTRQLGGYPGD